MSSSLRVKVIAGILIFGFAVGLGWLVYSATGSPGYETSDSTADSQAADPSASEPSSGPPPSPEPPDPGPPKPGSRVVTVSGARLDGDQPDDTCGLLFLDPPVEMLVHIDEIALSADPSSVGVELDDAGCDDVEDRQPFCDGASLGTGGAACFVGFSVSPQPAPGVQYTITAVLTLRVRCTGGTSWPCDEVDPPPPSTGSPVDVVWEDSSGPELVVPLEVEIPPPSPETTSPSTPTPSQEADSTSPEASPSPSDGG